MNIKPILFSFLFALATNSSAQYFENITTSCINLLATKSSLSAVCRAQNGASYKTALRLRGINNINGVLTVSPDSSVRSKFHTTCDNIAIDSYGILSARCQDADKKYRFTQLDITTLIKNYNGTMVYPND